MKPMFDGNDTRHSHYREYLYIAAAEDSDRDRPCFMFSEPPVSLIRHTFQRLTGSRVMMSEGAQIDSCFVIRHGKPRVEITAELIGANTRYYSPELMRELITIVIGNLVPCNVSWMSVDEFINIKNTKP